VDPVSADVLKQVHYHFAVTPGVHEQGVKASLVGCHTQPKEVTVNSLQLADEGTDGLRPGGSGHTCKLFNRQGVGCGMDMGTDTTYSLQQVDVLRPVSTLCRLFNPTMNVPQPDGSTGDDLAIYRELKMPRFF
jgi:hypothetical protein